jgi:aryl-alcohol dehydrogenase-like predicted oxidoreductase
MRLVIGTANFGMKYGFLRSSTCLSQKSIDEILEYAYFVGIRCIDTARLYGESEKAIGQYLRNHPDQQWDVITKITATKDGVLVDAHRSADQLGCWPKTILAHNPEDYSRREFCEALHDLKQRTSIKQVGVSVYSSADIELATSVISPDVVQLPLNILDRRLLQDGTLDYQNSLGTELHARSIFLKGLLQQEPETLTQFFPALAPAIQALENESKRFGLTIGEMSLTWVYSLSQVAKVVVGVESIQQLMHCVRKAASNDCLRDYVMRMNLPEIDETLLDPSKWPEI